MSIIKLSDIVDAIQMQSEGISYYLNKKTDEILPISEEEMGLVENDKSVEAVTDDYILLPSPFDIHEYEVMEKFCLSIEDQKISDDLQKVIKGRGAFRRFKDKIQQYDIEQDWYQHKNVAYRKIAKGWCEEHKIKFSQD